MRYVLHVSYDGTHFHGSQLQGEIETVQLALNKALATLLRKPVTTFGASRTDEGVHALSNYYHFDWDEQLPDTFLYNINAVIPHTLAVKEILIAKDPEFNVRFDALSRTYRYRVYRKKDPFRYHRALFFPFQLDVSLLKQTAAMLMEYTDFASFSKRNAQTKTKLCTISESRWEEVGDELHYVVTANRFLRGMVRGLVGTQLKVGTGKKTLEEFKAIIESGDSREAYFNVGGWGLYLEEVSFAEDAFVLNYDPSS